MKANPKLSKAGKMPSKSWSLEAVTTCPGAKIKGSSELVDACKGCYARGGAYRFKNVKAVRDHNMSDWKHDDWIEAMVKRIGNDPYFRWFDSGDMYDIRLARKILAVIEDTPDTQHWLPTRMHKFPKFQEVIAAMNSLENCVVRLSSDSVLGGIIDGDFTSTIVPDPSYVTDEMTMCPAYSRDGKCGDCRACWSRSVPVIAYPAHGRSMTKLVLKLAA